MSAIQMDISREILVLCGEMKYLYKTVEQKRQVLYHPIVTKEDYYKHELREFQKRWNLNGIMRVI